jgi:transposase
LKKEYLHKHYARPPLKHVTPIAIDEIAIQKGHKYLTVVMDLKTGRAIFVGDGKDAAALKPFWKKLRRARSKIVAVASDISELQRFANT